MILFNSRGNILLCLFSLFLISHAYSSEQIDSSVIELNDKNFYTALGSNSEWVIAFTAKWCGACKNLKPDYENFATALRKKKPNARVVRVDVDLSPALSNQFMITRLPTVYHLKNSEVRPMDEVRRDSESLQRFIMDEEWKEKTPYTGLFAPFSFLPRTIFSVISLFHRLANFARGQPTWVVAIVPLFAIILGIFSILRAPTSQPTSSEKAKKRS